MFLWNIYPAYNWLIHWSQVTLTCVGKLTIFGSDNGLAPSHYINQCWNIIDWTLRNKCHWNFNWNSNIFIQENALENVVCEMLSILSWPQCVKSLLSTFLQAFWRCRFPDGLSKARQERNTLMEDIPLVWHCGRLQHVACWGLKKIANILPMMMIDDSLFEDSREPWLIIITFS